MENLELVREVIVRCYAGVIPPREYDPAFVGNMLLVFSPFIDELAIPAVREEFCERVVEGLALVRNGSGRVM